MKHAFAIFGFALFTSAFASPSPAALNRCEFIFNSSPERTLAINPENSLYFESKIGKVEEYSLQNGPVAAHIYLDSETEMKPYLFFALPAENSGMGVWFNSPRMGTELRAMGPVTALARGNSFWGSELSLKTSTQQLDLADSVLGSMRFVRDKELGLPDQTYWHPTDITVAGTILRIRKPSLNGVSAYWIEIEALPGTRIVQNGPLEAKKFSLRSDSEVQFKIRGLTNEAPLTPMTAEQVFKPEYLKKINPEQLKRFLFLLYEEKWAAGSPRYFSNFFRDRAIIMNSLMPAIRPEALEKIFVSMISGMHPNKGIVSHEQHEGDYTSMVRKGRHQKSLGVEDKMEDYKMIDGDFLFAILFGKYLHTYPERSLEFLNGYDARGISLKKLVDNNFKFIAKATRNFTQRPIYSNLIHLHAGESTGQWRDSDFGLGGGRYPFDVNAALVPGALKQLATLFGNPGSAFFNKARADYFSQAFEVWNNQVLPLFEVRIAAKDVPKYGEQYLKAIHVDPSSLPEAPSEDIVFPAISLDEHGQPVAVMNSDDTMMMAFGQPSEAFLESASQRMRLIFPYGLNAKIAMLVANPVFAPSPIQKLFTENNYHGRVSWLMQEILWLQGSQRQIGRADLSPKLKAELATEQAQLRSMIRYKSSMGSQEVFAITLENGQFAAKPFAGDAKSNSNQGWSHLDLLDPIQ